jgi:outer membrane protein insertion porin family
MLYTEEEFRSVLNTSVVPLYERRGRIHVAFPKIRTEPARDVQGINVFVTVAEGQSYDLGKVEIAGPVPVSPTELLKAGDFKTGDLANFDRVNEGLDRIRKAVRRAGYMDARVSSSRRIDDQKKTVDVTVSVDAGSQFAMGKLNIVGLDLDSEAEMRRIWTMSLGKPFNPDYPDFFLSKVREAGLFDNLGSTEAEIQVNSQARTADVTLRFRGAGEEQRPPRRKQP